MLHHFEDIPILKMINPLCSSREDVPGLPSEPLRMTFIPCHTILLLRILSLVACCILLTCYLQASKKPAYTCYSIVPCSSLSVAR